MSCDPSSITSQTSRSKGKRKKGLSLARSHENLLPKNDYNYLPTQTKESLKGSEASEGIGTKKSIDSQMSEGNLAIRTQ